MGAISNEPGTTASQLGFRSSTTQSGVSSPRSILPGQAIPMSSLNVAMRKREYMKIMEENISILRRIESRKPVYSHRKWAKERKKMEGYMTRIMKKDRCTAGHLPSKRVALRSRRRQRAKTADAHISCQHDYWKTEVDKQVPEWWNTGFFSQPQKPRTGGRRKNPPSHKGRSLKVRSIRGGRRRHGDRGGVRHAWSGVVDLRTPSKNILLFEVRNDLTPLLFSFHY